MKAMRTVFLMMMMMLAVTGWSVPVDHPVPPEPSTLKPETARNAKVVYSSTLALNAAGTQGWVKLTFNSFATTVAWPPKGWTAVAVSDGGSGYLQPLYLPAAASDFIAKVAANPKRWSVFAWVDGDGTVWAMGREVKEVSFNKFEFVW